MQTYLVRLIKSERWGDTRDYVGVFVADSLSGLARAIDEFTDPSMCQYKVVPFGGGVFFQNLHDNLAGVRVCENGDMYEPKGRWRNLIPKDTLAGDFMWHQHG